MAAFKRVKLRWPGSISICYPIDSFDQAFYTYDLV